MKRFLKVVFFGMAFFFAVFIGYILPRLPASIEHLELENQSGSKIDTLRLEVCDLKFGFHDVQIGAKWGIKFPVTHDSEYNVQVHLSSGAVINADGGYVAHGLDSPAKMIIFPNEISFKAE